MKKIAISAALAIACGGAAVAPTMMDRAHAQSGDTRTIALQAPSARAAAITAASEKTTELAKAVGLADTETLKVKDVVTDSDGSTHVRVDRFHQGIPVVGGDLVIHRDPSGKVTGHSGTFDGAITVDTTPRLTAAQAAPKGLAAARATAGEEGLNSPTSAAPTLAIYVSPQGEQHLTYQVSTEGLANDRTPSRIRSYVDAATGASVASWDQIAHADGKGIFTGDVKVSSTKGSSGYELRNAENGGSTTDSGNKKTTGSVFTSSTDSFGDGTNNDRASAAVDAQFGADATFDFFKSVLGRNGIWDNGKGTMSRVHYDDNYVNAFWDGKQMTYGDGEGNAHPLTELDVSGHEMTHGVTENTAGLAYMGDAGGLNEATSDIFGTAVEWYANLAKDTPDYLVGELIDINGDGTPLRYMDKPSKDGASPDCWSGTVSTMDPHNSSGPLNHWFYLASEGSGKKTINGVSYDSPTCNSSTVKGAGHGDIEKVWYRTLATKLTSGSTYKDAREGAITSATELFGANSQQCKSVETAFDAIAVPKGSASCGNGPAPAPTTTPAPNPTTTAPAPTPAPTTPAPAPTTTAPAPVPTTTAPAPAPTTAPAPAPSTGGIVDGGFEQGSSWTGSGASTTDASIPARSGNGKLVLSGDSSAAQSITVPANATLNLYAAAPKSGSGSLKVQLFDEGTRIGYNLATLDASRVGKSYGKQSFSVRNYGGKKMSLRLISSGKATFAVDDVDMK